MESPAHSATMGIEPVVLYRHSASEHRVNITLRPLRSGASFRFPRFVERKGRGGLSEDRSVDPGIGTDRGRRNGREEVVEKSTRFPLRKITRDRSHPGRVVGGDEESARPVASFVTTVGGPSPGVARGLPLSHAPSALRCTSASAENMPCDSTSAPV
ncbi:hypothetical protein MRX96_014273 [Rhipicephalus microplus]